MIRIRQGHTVTFSVQGMCGDGPLVRRGTVFAIANGSCTLMSESGAMITVDAEHVQFVSEAAGRNDLAPVDIGVLRMVDRGEDPWGKKRNRLITNAIVKLESLGLIAGSRTSDRHWQTTEAGRVALAKAGR